MSQPDHTSTKSGRRDHRDGVTWKGEPEHEVQHQSDPDDEAEHEDRDRRHRRGWRRRWPLWIPYAATIWSFAVAGLALYCTVTGSGYPLPTDPEQSSSLLADIPAQVGTVALLCAALTSGVLSVLAARRRGLGSVNRVAVAVLVLMAVPLLFVVPDSNLLVMLGYAPIFLVGAPFGWPPVNYFDSVTWPMLFQLISVLGGVLLVSTALVWRRRARHSCLWCGRTAVPARWATPESAAVWGRWAVLVAIVPPLLYAMDRWAWAAGIPLGISQDFLDQMHRTGLVWAGFGLGTFAFFGAVLTLGLVQNWGEIFPRWMLGLAGKRVPPMLAVVPSTLVAIFVLSAAVPIVEAATQIAENSGASLGLLQGVIMGAFPFWGLALGAATLAYHLRRRGTCQTCHRG